MSTAFDADAALNFLSFVEARHRIWEARQAGLPQNMWTDDPVLASHKFTNVFRVLDYGTQFIFTDLLEDGLSPRDTLMRLFLYRHTGRTEVWKHVQADLGGYPTFEQLDDVLESMKDYRGETKITQRGQEARNNPGEKRTFQRSVFTGAYLVFPQTHDRGSDKLESIIGLTKRLFTPGSAQDCVIDFVVAEKQADRFKALRRNKGVADFMSMQILTDWGYTEHCGEDREDEFIVPGPGAKKGAAVIDPSLKAEQVVRWAQMAIHGSPDCPKLGDRLPSLMDVQNCLCEFSKYVRFAGGSPSRYQPYRPAHPGVQSVPQLPMHW